jgi:RNA polymerase sigma-70 factor (ECF subfamily)
MSTSVSAAESLPADWAEAADLRLVRAIAEGSADALAELYDRHAALVFGLARRITGQQEDAEEVVQDVFAQVWRQADRYQDGRASVVAWLVMLARTRAIDRLRARTARPDSATTQSAESVVVVSLDRTPEQKVLSGEEARRIRRTLDTLPDSQRALIDLAYFEGLTHSEIASREGLPLGTVKTRLRTALASLREAIIMTPRPS